ncbi:MAG TPA: dihydrolipoyl dehydrogenase, partial [Verrucomicrobiae bacterium]|nr:dihydrolipoyl dehydrogenase [Verrucomicrobiae bacterium]
MAAVEHDLVVIGAGPGGYVAAIRAAQLGLNVACVERERALGGTCLRIGCIPSKALLESSERFHEAQSVLGTHGVKVSGVELDLPTMLRRKDQVVSTLTKGVDFLFKKNKITRYGGTARLDGPGRIVVDDGTELKAKHIIIATGSVPASLPNIAFDGQRICSSTEALAFDSVPKHLVVIGAGYIGLELGSVWKRLGAKVTVLEYLDRILPGMDTEIATDAQKLFQKQGLEFRLGAKVRSAFVKGASCVVEVEGAEPVVCDRVLVAVGRKPNTQNLGLEAVKIQLDEKGRIPVNDHFATSAPGVFAIGDVIRGPMLAHKAEEEGVACVEHIVTGYGHVDYNAIPGIVYTNPEIASVGKTEDELRSAGIEYRKGAFPFRANGRALALGQVDGKIKIL